MGRTWTILSTSEISHSLIIRESFCVCVLMNMKLEVTKPDYLSQEAACNMVSAERKNFDP